MRTIVLSLTLITALLLASCGGDSASKTNFDAFYEKYEKADGVMSFGIPAFLFKGMVQSDNPETERIKSLVEDVNIFVCDRKVNDLFPEQQRFMPESDYEEITRMNKGKSELIVYFREIDDNNSEIISTALEDSRFASLQVKGKLNKEDIKTLIRSVNIEEVIKMQP